MSAEPFPVPIGKGFVFLGILSKKFKYEIIEMDLSKLIMVKRRFF